MTPRNSTADAQPSIELHIEELVLLDLSLTPGQGRVVQTAVETELALLLTEQGMSRSSPGATPYLSAGSIQLTNYNTPTHLGRQVAQAVYSSLTSTPTSPSQAPSNHGVFG